MLHLESFDSFVNETLRSHSVSVALKVIARELGRIGFEDRDFSLGSDYYMYNLSKSYRDDIDRQARKSGQPVDEVIDKAVRINIGAKLGKTYDVHPVRMLADNFERVMHVIEASGWFMASATVYTLTRGGTPESTRTTSVEELRRFVSRADNKIDLVTMDLDPYYDTEQDRLPVYYHATHVGNVEAILRNGLMPKSHSKRSYYPQRIFLATSLECVRNIIPQLKGEDGGEYAILEVKPPKDLKLYRDTRFRGCGVYAVDPIGPDRISTYKDKVVHRHAEFSKSV